MNRSRGIMDVTPPPLPWSVLYRVLLAKIFDGKFAPTHFGGQFILQGDDKSCGLIIIEDEHYCSNLDMTAIQLLQTNKPIYFDRNLRNIVAIAQQNEIQVMFSTWAYFADPIPSYSPVSFFAVEYRREAIAEHNVIVQQISTDFGLPVFDLFTELDYNVEYWVDEAHLTEAGALVQAQLYADFIVSNNLISKP